MDPKAQAESRVGTTLCNKWTLEKLLGVGGMAAVYVGRHKIGRLEAIKILHREVANSPDLRARFEAEAHAVNRFRHPGAVEIRDIDVTEEGAPFLVMELLEGESMAERARRLGGIPIPELLPYVDEILDVLAAAHAQGIIHRDIKLDNLFIQNDGHIKVLDFGIARFRDGLPQQMRTRVGAALGTAPYMPPEQVKGTPIDGRADIFAVGATMFRLLAKRRIHEAKTEPEMLVKMATQPAPPLASVAPETPREICMIVDRALHFDREGRYPDALTMQADVRAVRAGGAPPFASARLAADADPRREAATIMAAAGSAAMADPPTRGVATPPAPLGELPTRSIATPPGALTELPTRNLPSPAGTGPGGTNPMPRPPLGSVVNPMPQQPPVAMFESAPTSLAVVPAAVMSAGRQSVAEIAASAREAPTLYGSAGIAAPPDDPNTIAQGAGKVPLGFEPTLMSVTPMGAQPATPPPSVAVASLPIPSSASPPSPMVMSAPGAPVPSAPIPSTASAPMPSRPQGPNQKLLLVLALGLIFALLGAVIALAWKLRDKGEDEADGGSTSSEVQPEGDKPADTSGHEDRAKGLIIKPKKKR